MGIFHHPHNDATPGERPADNIYRWNGMRVRPELTNRLRASSSAKNSHQVVGQSFNEALKTQTANVQQPQRWLHHAQRRPPKNITLDQANRLARYAPVIKDCARRYNVPVELICAVVLQESGGNPRARSSAGAQGLMQLMPATAKRFGVTNTLDPKQNIEGGTKYLRFLLDRFNGDYRLALAGYNAGEGNVEKYGNRIPPFAETRNYVPNVLAYADTIWQILRTPQTASVDLPPHAKKV